MPKKRATRSTQVEGNQVSIATPGLLSLVKKPANQRAFSIIRSQEDNPTMPVKRVRNLRRSDAGNLARLQFPADMTEEAVHADLLAYGLATFQVSRADDQAPWIAQNSAIACTDDELLSHKVTEDGVIAFVKRSATLSPQVGKSQIAVTAIRFDSDLISDEAAEAWLRENAIDFDAKDLNNSSGKLVLQRMDLEEGEESRQIQLAEGIVAEIVRSDSQDIPEGFVVVISECAYSGYGWGQVDFAAGMADRTVGEGLREGVDLLETTFRNILFWNNDLTIEAKKLLVARAASQFTGYVNTLLDSLPRQLLVPVATAQRSDKESADMKTQNPAPAAAITLAEVASTVREVLQAVRKEEADAELAAQALVTQEEAQAEEARVAKEAQRSELKILVEEATAPLLAEIAALKGTTVVRSEDNDPVPQPRDAKRSEGNIFAGILGGGIAALQDINDDPEADESAADE